MRTYILYGDNAQERPISWRRYASAAPQNPIKTQKDRDIIRFDQDESHIKMQIRKNVFPIASTYI